MAPLLVAVVIGCAVRGARGTGDTADVPPEGVGRPVSAEREQEETAATAPDRPMRIRFDWSLRDRDASFEGRGVARVEPPYHARLDLFGPRGEGYLSAALVFDEIRLPPGSSDAPVPPAPLLWSTLGIFRPPAGAELVLSEVEGDRLRFEYARAQDRWRFELEGGRLRSAEWEPAVGGRHTVELEGESRLGRPGQAVYRDWAAFRELTLRLDEIEYVEAFPPEIWRPGAR